MPRLSMWSPTKNNNYKFFDRVIKEQFMIGGTAIMFHKYIGTENGDETTIQDVVWMENRDRKYDKDVYELRGVYNVVDNDFDLQQWGLMLPSDTLFIAVHINDTVDRIGRKPMTGDVIELPHMRDDLLLDPDAPAINKFYKVEDVNRASEGFSPTWFPHIFRMRVKPLDDAQEYAALVGNEGGADSILDILSTYQNELDINDAWFEKAVDAVPHRNFATQQFWVAPPYEFGQQYPWIFAGDGEPPRGAEITLTGTSFPMESNEGDYFLHTGYEPNTLFQKLGTKWIRVEVDWQATWSAASRVLESHINNDAITEFNTGEQQPEKQNLTKVMTRRDNKKIIPDL